MVQVGNSHSGVIPPEGLQPRKTPRQARSEATVDAMFQATIQVLLADGARRLTTTRVAARAGVSVGTMYQYFPHKEALLYAVLQQHLDTVVVAVEAACARHQGQNVAAIADGLVKAYIDAKTASVEASRVLYLVADELDTVELLGGVTQRVHDVTAGLLASAADVVFEDVFTTTFALLGAMAGMTRIVFARGATPPLLRALRTELAVMCRAYLTATGSRRSPV